MIQGAKPFPVASFRDESNQQMFFFCRNHKLNEITRRTYMIILRLK